MISSELPGVSRTGRKWPTGTRLALRSAVDCKQWHASGSDVCVGPTSSAVMTDPAVVDFHSLRYLHNTARRLEHLATLGLPLHRRSVLEVGAGIGDLTQFFADRGCSIHATEARASHLSVLAARYENHPFVTTEGLNLDPPPANLERSFEVVVSYGVLYHLSDPAAALDLLAAACTDLMIVETIVGDGDELATNPVAEDAALAGAAYTGKACRPSRRWVTSQLRQRFEFVYLPETQPNHYEFPVDWSVPSPFSRRAIFIASRRPLDNPLLTPRLPDRQHRH